MSRLFAKAFFASLALAGVVSQARAVDVVESRDFPNSADFGAGAISIGTLDFGANSVEGDLDGECPPDLFCGDPFLGDSSDCFTMIVPSETAISSVVVTTDHVTGPDGFTATIYSRSPTTPIVIPPTYIVLDGISGNLLVDPIREGEYVLCVYGQSAEEPGPFTFSWGMGIQLDEGGFLFGDGFESADTSEWFSTVGGI